MLKRFYFPDPVEGGVTLDMVHKSIDGLKGDAQKTFLEIQEKIKKLNDDGATKAEIKEFKESLEKCSKDIETVNTFAENLQKELKAKQLSQNEPSFGAEIASIVEKNHSDIVAKKSAKTPMDFEAKALIAHKDMSFTGNTTGMVIRPDFDPTIIGQPFQIPHLRTMVRAGTTSGNAYYYPKATLKSGAPASVQPGGLKPEIQYQIDGKIAPVIKIAGHVRLPEEMIDDIEGLTSYLQNYLPEEVLKVEDTEILTGDGSTGHFNGLITQASVHTPTAGVVATESWDLLADGIAQQQNKWLPANRVMTNPIDWMFLVTRKSTDGVYSHPTLIVGTPLTVAGLSIVPHPKIAIDQYLIGDFTKAELKVRRGITVRFYDQDQDNAVKNMITVVAEERAAFAVYFPEAFLKGDFGRVA